METLGLGNAPKGTPVYITNFSESLVTSEMKEIMQHYAAMLPPNTEDLEEWGIDFNGVRWNSVDQLFGSAHGWAGYNLSYGKPMTLSVKFQKWDKWHDMLDEECDPREAIQLEFRLSQVEPRQGFSFAGNAGLRDKDD